MCQHTIAFRTLWTVHVSFIPPRSMSHSQGILIPALPQARERRWARRTATPELNLKILLPSSETLLLSCSF